MLQKFDMRGAWKIFFLLLVSVVFSSENLLAQNQNNAAAKKDALVLYRERKYTEAIAVCEEEIKQDPNKMDAYAVMCWALIANKQYNEAKQRAAIGLRVNPNDFRLMESMGEACFYLGENVQALDFFQRFVGNAQDSGNRVDMAYYFMGEIFVRQERYQHADIAFTVAVQKSPEQDFWWTRLGYAREKARNDYEALNAYDEALRLNPTSTEAANGKARVVRQMR